MEEHPEIPTPSDTIPAQSTNKILMLVGYLALVIAATLFCLDIITITKAMTIIAGGGFGFWPIGPVSGIMLTLPLITALLLLCLAAGQMRMLVGIILCGFGFYGFHNGPWHYITIGYFSYDPDGHMIKPSVSALLVAITLNFSLVAIGIICGFNKRVNSLRNIFLSFPDARSGKLLEGVFVICAGGLVPKPIVSIFDFSVPFSVRVSVSLLNLL